MDFEALVIVVTVIVVMLIMSISQGRRNGSRCQQRVCGSCGASHPPFAQFCRRCGLRL